MAANVPHGKPEVISFSTVMVTVYLLMEPMAPPRAIAVMFPRCCFITVLDMVLFRVEVAVENFLDV